MLHRDLHRGARVLGVRRRGVRTVCRPQWNDLAAVDRSKASVTRCVDAGCPALPWGYCAQGTAAVHCSPPVEGGRVVTG